MWTTKDDIFFHFSLTITVPTWPAWGLSQHEL